MSPLVSIIVPVYNGAALVPACRAALGPVLDRLGRAEVVYVDDGSRDGTMEALAAAQADDARVRVVELAANFGQHAAFAAGFEHARGRFLVTMDLDLQCDPNDIPRLVALLEEGYDLVSGVRMDRRDPLVRRLFSSVTTALVTRLAGVQLRDVGCPLNALTAEVGRSVSASGEMRRFLKPTAVRMARRVAEVEVRHRPRPGRRASSYSATQLVRLFMDFLVTALGSVFAWTFLAAGGLALLLGVGALAATASAAAGEVGWWVPAGVAFGGLLALLVALGALAGDYVQRLYRQSAGLPFYLVRGVHEAEEAAGVRR